jgi:hypothetical protein
MELDSFTSNQYMENKALVAASKADIRIDDISHMPANKVLFIQQLTAEPPIRPMLVPGLSSIQEVIEFYKPSSQAILNNFKGEKCEETLHFESMADFSPFMQADKIACIKKVELIKMEARKLAERLKVSVLFKSLMASPEEHRAFTQRLRSAIIKDKKAN